MVVPSCVLAAGTIDGRGTHVNGLHFAPHVPTERARRAPLEVRTREQCAPARGRLVRHRADDEVEARAVDLTPDRFAHSLTGMSTLRYEVVTGWEQLPAGYQHRDVAGVAVDGEDRVYLICRGEHPVIVYDQKGNFIRSWGEGEFTYRTHGITIAPDGTVFCTDDGNHTVRQFTPEGKLLLTLGTLNTPSDTGYDGKNTLTVSRPGGPFNRPTNIAVGPKGDLYVSDGYGNCRVHRFSPTGRLERSWGTPGRGPGEFVLPHGIAVDRDGRVFVCDRENDRIQIFSPDGEYLTEWTDTRRPTHLVFDRDGRAYVSELWWQPGQTSPRYGPGGDIRYGRVSVYDRDGRVLARWGKDDPVADGGLAAPHGIAVDSKGDVYVSEVTWTFAVSRGFVPDTCHTFQKFRLATA
jgi:DNA-binding beta-propeller fold protein YncE